MLPRRLRHSVATGTHEDDAARREREERAEQVSDLPLGPEGSGLLDLREIDCA